MEKYKLKEFQTYKIPQGLEDGTLSDLEAVVYLKSLGLDSTGAKLFTVLKAEQKAQTRKVSYKVVGTGEDTQGKLFGAGTPNPVIPGAILTAIENGSEDWQLQEVDETPPPKKTSDAEQQSEAPSQEAESQTQEVPQAQEVPQGEEAAQTPELPGKVDPKQFLQRYLAQSVTLYVDMHTQKLSYIMKNQYDEALGRKVEDITVKKLYEISESRDSDEKPDMKKTKSFYLARAENTTGSTTSKDMTLTFTRDESATSNMRNLLTFAYHVKDAEMVVALEKFLTGTEESVSVDFSKHAGILGRKNLEKFVKELNKEKLVNMSLLLGEGEANSVDRVYESMLRAGNISESENTVTDLLSGVPINLDTVSDEDFALLRSVFPHVQATPEFTFTGFSLRTPLDFNKESDIKRLERAVTILSSTRTLSLSGLSMMAFGKSSRVLDVMFSVRRMLLSSTAPIDNLEDSHLLGLGIIRNTDGSLTSAFKNSKEEDEKKVEMVGFLRIHAEAILGETARLIEAGAVSDVGLRLKTDKVSHYVRFANGGKPAVDKETSSLLTGVTSLLSLSKHSSPEIRNIAESTLQDIRKVKKLVPTTSTVLKCLDAYKALPQTEDVETLKKFLEAAEEVHSLYDEVGNKTSGFHSGYILKNLITRAGVSANIELDNKSVDEDDDYEPANKEFTKSLVRLMSGGVFHNKDGIIVKPEDTADKIRKRAESILKLSLKPDESTAIGISHTLFKRKMDGYLSKLVVAGGKSAGVPPLGSPGEILAMGSIMTTLQQGQGELSYIDNGSLADIFKGAPEVNAQHLANFKIEDAIVQRSGNITTVVMRENRNATSGYGDIISIVHDGTNLVLRMHEIKTHGDTEVQQPSLNDISQTIPGLCSLIKGIPHDKCIIQSTMLHTGHYRKDGVKSFCSPIGHFRSSNRKVSAVSGMTMPSYFKDGFSDGANFKELNTKRNLFRG